MAELADAHGSGYYTHVILIINKFAGVEVENNLRKIWMELF